MFYSFNLNSLWIVLGLLCVSQCSVQSAAILKLSNTEPSHRYWEHMVRRTAYFARYNHRTTADNTAHIVNIQEYYKHVLKNGWEEDELQNSPTITEAINSEDSSLDKVTSQALRYMFTHTKPILGRYIVMLGSDSDDSLLDRVIAVMEEADRVSVRKVRTSHVSPLRFAGKGFIATLNKMAVELLAKHPAVDFIEKDIAFRRSQAIITNREEARTTSDTPPWNLDRIDQHSNKLDHVYNPDGDGSNVDIYIIDSGIRDTHDDLEGRVVYAGFDAVDALTGSNRTGADCDGHGTSCAGIAAGTSYGVAKNATIFNLRAIDCDGTGAVSGIVLGIDMVIKRKQESNSGRPIVISQSLDVEKLLSLNRAVEDATNAGIVCVSAAGNQASDSCEYSPGSATVGISVGATDKGDNLLYFTNTGKCTTIMAPGLDITSASFECDNCEATALAGTSVSTPHVAGYAAIVLGEDPTLTPAQFKERMIAQSTKGAIKMSAAAEREGTPDRLLYVQSKSANAAQGQRGD